MNTITTNTQVQATALEKAVLEGDLSKLSEAERLIYYTKTCDSLGLNPLTKPFQYIKLNGSLKLYASKDCTEQLRKLNQISIPAEKIKFWDNDGYIFCQVSAYTKDGRSDTDIGSVKLQGTTLDNAYKKALTQAKRRATLSICGLGMLDESDIQSIPASQIEIIDMPPVPEAENIDIKAPVVSTISYCNGEQSKELSAIAKQYKLTNADMSLLIATYGYDRLSKVPLDQFDKLKAFVLESVGDVNNG